jgi:uncharacterized protein
MRQPNRFWNPYGAGVALGLVLLAALALTGKGLGASGASFRVGVAMVGALAPGHVEQVPLMAAKVEDGPPLKDWLVFEVVGVILGGFLGALTSGRFRGETLKGPTFPTGRRLAFAAAGGLLMGAAAQMARGCTSGQALSGGALMSAGSWAFMMMVFAGGYAAAYFVRRQWQ